MLPAEVEGWMDNIIQNIGFIPKPEEEHMLFCTQSWKPSRYRSSGPFYILFIFLGYLLGYSSSLKTQNKTEHSYCYVHLYSQFLLLKKKNLGIKASMRLLVHSFSLLH